MEKKTKKKSTLSSDTPIPFLFHIINECSQHIKTKKKKKKKKNSTPCNVSYKTDFVFIPHIIFLFPSLNLHNVRVKFGNLSISYCYKFLKKKTNKKYIYIYMI